MKRSPIACALVALLPFIAAAQPAPKAPEAPKSSVFLACPECGVVRSIKRLESTAPLTDAERKDPSGLVAAIPLGGGKPHVGSSTEVRHELKPEAVSYEIVVRLDDGRFQLVRQDDAGSLREGDKVRIERGKVLLRER